MLIFTNLNFDNINLSYMGPFMKIYPFFQVWKQCGIQEKSCIKQQEQ